MAGNITHLTEATFDEHIMGASGPVLVDFWADWCGPCKKLAPILDEIAAEHATLEIAKVDVQDQQGLAVRFGVQSIPTLILFNDGEPVTTIVGSRPKADLVEMVDQHI